MCDFRQRVPTATLGAGLVAKCAAALWSGQGSMSQLQLPTHQYKQKLLGWDPSQAWPNAYGRGISVLPADASPLDCKEHVCFALLPDLEAMASNVLLSRHRREAFTVPADLGEDGPLREFMGRLVASTFMGPRFRHRDSPATTMHTNSRTGHHAVRTLAAMMLEISILQNLRL